MCPGGGASSRVYFPCLGPQRWPPCAWDHNLGVRWNLHIPGNCWEGLTGDTAGFGILKNSSSLKLIPTPPEWKWWKQQHQQVCIAGRAAHLQPHSQLAIQDTIMHGWDLSRNRPKGFRQETFAVPRSAVTVHEKRKLYLVPEFSLWENGTMVSTDSQQMC